MITKNRRDDIEKVFQIGSPNPVGPRHARERRDGHSALKDSGITMWLFGVAIATIPLFVVPGFRLLTGSVNVSDMFFLALSGTGMLYVGVTMAITSLSDVESAGLGAEARVYHLSSLLMLAVGLVIYSLLAIAPEVHLEVPDITRFWVNVVYIGVELALGFGGYVLIGRR